jgi:outer membrane protein assembly factor BamB/DNA-directed RNA polymerase subunit RPC12/RpoP
MKAFNCPQCGASLEFERIENPLVRCNYCNSMVVVPAELRPTPASPPPPEPERSSADAYGDVEPKKIAVTIVALVLAAAGLGLLVSRCGRTSNRLGLVQTPTPRFTPAQTPTPKPAGYSVAYTLGGKGTGPGLFEDDMTVAVAADGQVYVSDESRRVQRFDSSGKFVNTWNIPVETKWYEKLRGGPHKLLLNSAGQLYAVLAGVILKLDGETGEVLGAAHGSDYIHDAANAPGGGLLIVSQKGEDDELVLLGGDGRAARRTHRFVSSLLDKKLEVEALRVASDGAGDTYALYAIGGVEGEHSYDDEDIAVFKYSPNGKYLARFGGEGDEPGQYGPPTTFAVDSEGRAYVCEAFDKIHVFNPDGRFLRTLKAPHGVESLAFDAQGALYVAGGNKVSKLVLDR